MTLTISSARAALLAAAGTQNNPIIAWENLAATATITTPLRTAPVGGEAINAVSGTTFDAWTPDALASIGNVIFKCDMGSAVAPDFIGVIGHNAAALGVTSIRVDHSVDGSTWVAIGDPITAANMSGVADGSYFSGAPARQYWRVVFYDVPAFAVLSVAGIFIGNVLTVPDRFYQGFAPVITPTEVELQSNVSAGGNLLGSSVTKRGSRIGLNFDHLPQSFVRGAQWMAFQRAFNDGNPAFLAWRPTKYGQDLHYIWRDGAVIRPSNSGPKDYMSAQVEARVFEGAAP